MNPIDRCLNRLFKAASGAPKAQSGAATFTLETRVMADWRAKLSEEGGDFLLAWFRRAAICACLLAVASLAWNYQQLTNGGSEDWSGSESAMRIGVEP
ncbi:MAG: hypothetical protein JWR26_664 [Pedosphaera sp.]|nr:hypothetical protein [Pedosphaera sp.]